MTLDLSEVKKIAKDEAIGMAIAVGAHIERNSCNSEMLTSFTEYELLAFAQAIYAMGAAEQKEKSAQVFLDNAKGCWTNAEMADLIRSQE